MAITLYPNDTPPTAIGTDPGTIDNPTGADAFGTGDSPWDLPGWRLMGLGGDDTYWIKEKSWGLPVGVTIVEAAGGGFDKVTWDFQVDPTPGSLEEFALPPDVEFGVAGFSAGNLSILGNAGDNIIVTTQQAQGGDGDDVIFANVYGAGAFGVNFTLDGGAGNDVISLSEPGDHTITGGSGFDVLHLDYDGYPGEPPGFRPSVVASLALQGTAQQVFDAPAPHHATASFTGFEGLMGTIGNDTLFGDDTANLLIGHIGNDLLEGGGGNDTLVAGTPYQRLVGIDAPDSYFLHGGLLRAYEGDPVGGSGYFDTLVGGAGDDLYVLGRAAAWVGIVEAEAAGHDTVLSWSNYILAAHVEDLLLQDTVSGAELGEGNALANLIRGNALDNTLTGHAGNDTLDGATGQDTLIGGVGDDLYRVDNRRDRITELAGEGEDRVESSVNHRLADHVEHLTLTGTKAIDGTGNGLANAITGNAKANLLNGGGGDDSLVGGNGNDSLIGGRGADELYGGAGADAFRWDSNRDGSDIILDFNAADDVLVFSAAGFGGGLVAGMDIAATGRFAATADGKATIATGQFVLNTTTLELVFDANGTAAGGRTLVATLNTAAITAADFEILA